MLHNKKRLLNLMDEYGLDVIIASSYENVFYLSEFSSIDQFMIKSQCFVVYPRNEDLDPVLIMPASNYDLLSENPSWIKHVVSYGNCPVEGINKTDLSDLANGYRDLVVQVKPFKNSMDALLSVLKSLNLSDKVIGIDDFGVPFSFLDELKFNLNGRLHSAAEVLADTRMVKTEEEIKRLKKSSQVTEQGIYTAMKKIEVGMTEYEIYKIFANALIENNVNPILKCILVNEHSAFANASAGESKVELGEIIRFDVGGSYKGYNSDTARIAIVGEPNQKQSTYYDAIVKGEKKAIEMIKPGVVVADLFDTAMNEVRDSGIGHYKRHHVGHGIGIQIYDKPLISGENETLIEEGMVLNIETPYYELGFGGLQIEDTILVTSNGYEYITKLSDEIFVL